MPDLLHHQERDRLIAALRRSLRPAVPGGRIVPGLARTEAPGASLWLIDNALAAEAMAIPALRAADPGLADAVLTFLTTVAEEPGPAPRAVWPEAPRGQEGRVEILRDDPSNLRVVTPWYEFTGDLAHGTLRQRMREAPGAAQPARDRAEEDGRRSVLHTGNMVRLRAAGGLSGLLGRLSLRARTLDVEEAVVAQGVQPEGAGAVMWHESALRLRPLPGLSLPVGTVRYEYRVSPADPLLRLTVTLRAGGRSGLSAVRLTTAADAMSEAVPAFTHVSIGRGEGQSARPPGSFEAETLLSEGETGSVHVWQSGPEEEALALHIRPRAPEGVFSVRVTARRGVPHWLVLRHRLPDLPPGGTVTLREDRLLARGFAHGTPAAALRQMRGPEALAAREPGEAGIGAALSAVAATLLNAPAFANPIPRDRLLVLQDWLDRQIAALPDEETAALSVAELSRLALALDAVWRAGGLPRDRRRLRGLLTRLAADGATGDPALADQGAAILALARGAALIPEAWMFEALRRAVLALDEAALGAPSGPDQPSTWALASVLRGLRAVEFLAETGRIAPDAAVLVRAASLREGALQRLSTRLRTVEGRLEVLPAEGGQADAPSIAALLLAVLSPDEAALSMGLVAA